MPTVLRNERIIGVHCDNNRLFDDLMDGRSIAVPLVWYPRLFNATPTQRAAFEVAGGGYGIHWPEIDEDLNVEGLLQGVPAPRLTGCRAGTARYGGQG